MIFYNHCPVCNSEKIHKQLSATDHTVSGEQFEIWECSNCTLRFTQNAPEKEDIGKYYQSENYVSHTETKRGMVNRLYHLVRKKTLKSKKSIIEKYAELKVGKLLDIGAGTGAFLNAMQTAGWQVRGLEPDVQAREKALELYNIELLPSEELFAQVPVYYDVITMWHVLEHVHDLHDYIIQIHKLLKPGGRAFIAVPNYTSADAKHYQGEWAAYDVPRHLYHFSPKSMFILLGQHKLSVVETLPMYFDSYYVSMLSEKNTRGKNHYVSALLNGSLSNMKAMEKKDSYSSLIYVVKK